MRSSLAVARYPRKALILTKGSGLLNRSQRDVPRESPHSFPLGKTVHASSELQSIFVRIRASAPSKPAQTLFGSVKISSCWLPVRCAAIASASKGRSRSTGGCSLGSRESQRR